MNEVVDLKKTSLQYLFLLKGDDFIFSAFQYVLGREPDQSGLAYYLDRLQCGFSTVSVFYQITASVEARPYVAKSSTLRKFILKYQMFKTPFIGSFLNIFFKFETNTSQHMFSRQFYYRLIRLDQKISSINALHADYHQSVSKLALDVAFLKNVNSVSDKHGRRMVFDDPSVLDQGLTSLGYQLLVDKHVHSCSLTQLGERLLLNNTSQGLLLTSLGESVFLGKQVNSLSTSVANYSNDPNPSEILSQDSEWVDDHADVNSSLTYSNGYIDEISIIMNITTSKNWRSRAVGIVRVERELAIFLHENNNVRFVYWNEEESVFYQLNESSVELILSPSWCNTPDMDQVLCDEKLLTSGIKKNDFFVSIGLDWDYGLTREIAEIQNISGCMPVLACYDLVPILFPEFAVRDGFDQLFKSHFVDMAHTANIVLVNSINTEKDLVCFWKAAAVDCVLPRVEVLSLAGLNVPSELPLLAESELNKLRHIKAQGDYVLYVSSFEARKNHQLLLNVWRDLYRDRGAQCPQLILVGMHGWGINDLISKIERMSAFKAGKIIWLQDVPDDLLFHLYSGCLFSAFPSLYEGFGLAVSEAMSFGKVCIVANDSSLNEASQYLMPSHHSLDFLSWKREIEQLIDEPSYLLELERLIQERFVTRTWKDFSREFVNCLTSYSLI